MKRVQFSANITSKTVKRLIKVFVYSTNLIFRFAKSDLIAFDAPILPRLYNPFKALLAAISPKL